MARSVRSKASISASASTRSAAAGDCRGDIGYLACRAPMGESVWSAYEEPFFPGFSAAAGWRDNTLQIEDIGSTNGTSINGERIATGVRHPLAPGSTPKLGHIELVVR